MACRLQKCDTDTDGEPTHLMFSRRRLNEIWVQDTASRIAPLENHRTRQLAAIALG